MSRGQQQNVINTASSQDTTNFGNAQSAFGQAQNAESNYQNQLNKFVSGNPYTQGGEYDSTISTGLANASDAGSNSLKGALQSQALRTGQNSAADAATAASNAQQNTRNLSSSLANAQQQRINSEAGYNQQALSASAQPVSAESGLYGTASGEGNQELGTQETASQTPSFWDEVGNGLAGGLGGALTAGGAAYGKAAGGCWVAAEAFGGWEDPRTHLVRGWIFGTFQHTKIGGIIAKLYLRFGERAAMLMRQSKIVRWGLTLLCNLALRQARKEA
jgi:hypothetical protein